MAKTKKSPKAQKPSKERSDSPASLFTESKARFYAYKADVVSKDLPVFYNPAMEVNRDITILLLNALDDKDLNLCDVLAGSGIRTIRFLLELDKGKISSLTSNDANPKFPRLLKKNLTLNNLSPKSLIAKKRLIIRNIDANDLLLASTGFSYIDIDPFGTPNPFLDSACKRLARDGILAVTATDTSALCGTYPRACERKYWADPRHDYLMHEAGLRILIRKVQLIAAQYEKALLPIYCYDHEHHVRIFFRATKQKTAVDDILSRHDHWDKSGPMWTGQLWDPQLAKKIAVLAKDYPKSSPIVSLIAKEAQIPVMGYIDIHEVGKKLDLGDLPKTESLMNIIRERGFEASRTHFAGSGVRTTMPRDQVEKLIKSVQPR